MLKKIIRYSIVALVLSPNASNGAAETELPSVTFTSDVPDSFDFTWDFIDRLKPVYRDDYSASIARIRTTYSIDRREKEVVMLAKPKIKDGAASE